MTTLERRSACLSKLQSKGYTGITETVREELIKIIERGWIIQREEFSGWRVTFYVVPRFDVSSKARYDLEGLLYKYGGSPHRLATEFDMYKLSFVAND